MKRVIPFVLLTLIIIAAQSFGVTLNGVANQVIALTLGEVTAGLGYTPLNPANNLSDVTAATARANLGVSAATLNGTSGAIGGSLLTVGTPVTTTISVTGATTSMGCVAFPAAGNALLTGTFVDCYVSSTGTVTLRLIGVVATTPGSQTYSVRVLP